MSSNYQPGRLFAAAIVGLVWPLFAPALIAVVSTASFAILAALPVTDASTLVLVNRVASAAVSIILVGALFGLAVALLARNSNLLFVWLAFVCGAVIGGFLFWPLGEGGLVRRIADLDGQLTPATWLGPLAVGVLAWLFRRTFSSPRSAVRVAP